MKTIKTLLVEAKKLSKPKPGQKMGANDQAAPEDATPYELSRLYDAMYYAQEAGIDSTKVFALASMAVRGEWNYSKWTYVAAK